MSRYDYGDWAPYVSVAEQRADAEREIARRRKKGEQISPVILDGTRIATTFWGKAWCGNLESYRDFETRLPRGRSYVRHRAVLDLRIAPRRVSALVNGSSVYKVEIDIAEVPADRWRSICRDCGSGIESLVELLRGRFSKGVMDRLCSQKDGLFPRPSEIKFSCTCLDFASMCKHVAAALYGVGARLDEQPELLFRLRSVDESDLLANLDVTAPFSASGVAPEKILAGDDVMALFGLDIAPEPPAEPAPADRGGAPRTAKKTRITG